MSIFNSFLNFFSEKKPAKPIISASSVGSIISGSSGISIISAPPSIAKNIMEEFFQIENSFLSDAKKFNKSIESIKETAHTNQKNLIEIQKCLNEIISTSEKIIQLNEQKDGSFGFETTPPGFDITNRSKIKDLILRNHKTVQKLSIIIEYMNDTAGLSTMLNFEQASFLMRISKRSVETRDLIGRILKKHPTEEHEFITYLQDLHGAISKENTRYNNLGLKSLQNFLEAVYQKASKNAGLSRFLHYFSTPKVSTKEEKITFFKQLKEYDRDKYELDKILEYSLKQLIPNPDVESRLNIIEKLENQAIQASNYCAPPQEIEKQALFERRLEKTISEINIIKTELGFNYDKYDYRSLDRAIAKIKSDLQTLEVIIEDEGFSQTATAEEMISLRPQA